MNISNHGDFSFPIISYQAITGNNNIDKNMTQVELAALLGCNKQYIHKILVGERSGKKYIEAISRILDIEIAA